MSQYNRRSNNYSSSSRGSSSFNRGQPSYQGQRPRVHFPKSDTEFDNKRSPFPRKQYQGSRDRDSNDPYSSRPYQRSDENNAKPRLERDSYQSPYPRSNQQGTRDNNSRARGDYSKTSQEPFDDQNQTPSYPRQSDPNNTSQTTSTYPKSNWNNNRHDNNNRNSDGNPNEQNKGKGNTNFEHNQRKDNRNHRGQQGNYWNGEEPQKQDGNNGANNYGPPKQQKKIGFMPIDTGATGNFQNSISQSGDQSSLPKGIRKAKIDELSEDNILENLIGLAQSMIMDKLIHEDITNTPFTITASYFNRELEIIDKLNALYL